MKSKFAVGVSNVLENKGLCLDVSLKIEDIVRKMDFDVFKKELMEASYKLVIRKCDYYYDNGFATTIEDKFWVWTKYREVCFPNELSCTCCVAGYPGVECQKEWSRSQSCTCNQEEEEYTCYCDTSYRRHFETSQNCRDINQPDFEYFQEQMK